MTISNPSGKTCKEENHGNSHSSRVLVVWIILQVWVLPTFWREDLNEWSLWAEFGPCKSGTEEARKGRCGPDHDAAIEGKEP